MNISSNSSKIHIFMLHSLRSIKSFAMQCIDLKKIYIQLGGLILAGIIQCVFSTIASKFTAIDIFIKITGEFLSFIPILFAMAAATYIYLTELGENEKISVKNAIQKTQNIFYPIIRLLLQLYGITLAVCFVVILFNILVKVPFLGDLLWPLVFFINFSIGCLVLIGIIVAIILFHTIPASFTLFPDKKNILTNNIRFLMKTFPKWLPDFSLSAIISTIIFLIYYIATLIGMSISKYLLNEKFYSLISATPLYPGYLLYFIKRHFIPFDFVNEPRFTVTLGAFFWGIALYILLCLVMAVIFNILNISGAKYLYSKKASFSQQ